MTFEFSAGAILYKKEQKQFYFALILDSYGRWTFPKGHLEKGEKPEKAARRELAEEIGVKDPKIIKLLEKIDYWFKLEGQLIHKFVYFYLMEAPPGTKLSPQETEIKEARWFEPQAAAAILGYKKDSLPALKKAFLKLKIVL
jgi:8-oxo-dGTP diphosphatase